MNLKSIFNIPFGKIDDKSVQISLGMGGGITIAAKDKDGNLRSYNPAEKSIDVVPAELTFGDFPAFVIPTADKDIVAGDLILYNGKDLGYFVGLDADGKNKVVIDVKLGTVQTLVPTKSIFGFNFVAKVVSPLSALGKTGDGTAFDPTMLLLMGALGDGDLFDGDSDSMLPLLLLSGGLGGASGGSSPFSNMNPLMLMLMLKGGL